MNTKTYPRTNDYQTIYLNAIINNPNIIVGDYTIYNDFVNDPAQFEKNNVLYHYRRRHPHQLLLLYVESLSENRKVPLFRLT